VQANLEWASWIVTRRAAIDRVLSERLGDAMPGAAAPETEALRRFRSFAGARLRREDAGPPALDGLRVDAVATTRLVQGWCRVAEEVAGARGAELRALLDPLAARFQSALVGSEQASEARRAPRLGRRAVSGAIDRIADAFVAVDVDAGTIADLNPAAATLLRVAREALLGRPIAAFCSPAARGLWDSELESLLESAEPRRFRTALVDADGKSHAVEIVATRLATRDRVLALLLARVS
jgi:PAS domain S-box-containing protein